MSKDLRMQCLELALRMSGNDSIRADAWSEDRVLAAAKAFELYVKGEHVYNEPQADVLPPTTPAPQ